MSHDRGRATWIWRTKDIISDAQQAEHFVAFAQQNRLRRVYVHINPDFEFGDFEVFVSTCARLGIAVEALMGDPEWVRNPHHESVKSRLRWIEAYQKRQAEAAQSRFKGLHLDIEPWNIPGWKTNKEAHVDFLNVLGMFKDFGNNVKPPLPVTADLPFWLHKVLTKEHLDAVLGTLDGATFMTYRNSPDGVMGIAGVALTALGRHPGKSFDLAVETCPNNEGSHISYHGCTRARLNADLARIESEKIPGNERHRVGVAVHDYHHWIKMQ
ncbi:hypothetical protein LQW54_008890 [Pestalotiopsis sp. IQ-011]